MASSKKLTNILTDLVPKRLATVESSFKKTESSPRKGEKFFLALKINLDIQLKDGKEENAEKTVKIITTGNADVFTGLTDDPNEKRQLAEIVVKVESIYHAHVSTTEEDIKKNSDFFKAQSSITVYNTIRSLVANTDFYNMPLPLPRD